MDDAVIISDLHPEEKRRLYGGACGHSACRECGPLRARKALEPVARATELFTEPAIHLVLRGPVIRVARTKESFEAIQEFLEDIEVLADGFTYSGYGNVLWSAIATEWTCLNSRQARPHAHVAIQPAGDDGPAIVDAIVECWKRQGGEFQED